MTDLLADPNFLLIVLSMGFPFLLFVFLIVLDMIDSKKAKVLFFESEQLCRMMSKKVKDGMVEIKKKSIHVDKVKSLSYLSGNLVKSFRPLYIIKHDLALPLKFTENGIQVISASNLKNLIENKTLDQLLTPKTSSSAQIMFLIMGLIMGALVGYVISISM